MDTLIRDPWIVKAWYDHVIRVHAWIDWSTIREKYICGILKLLKYKSIEKYAYAIYLIQWDSNIYLYMYLYCIHFRYFVKSVIKLSKYSRTSNKGPSEKGTTSLQRTVPKVYLQYIYNFRKKNNPL